MESLPDKSRINNNRDCEFTVEREIKLRERENAKREGAPGANPSLSVLRSEGTAMKKKLIDIRPGEIVKNERYSSEFGSDIHLSKFPIKNLTNEREFISEASF